MLLLLYEKRMEQSVLKYINIFIINMFVTIITCIANIKHNNLLKIPVPKFLLRFDLSDQ